MYSNNLLYITMLLVATFPYNSAGICNDMSFNLNAIVTTSATYGDIMISVVGQNSPQPPLPSGFTDAKEYKDTCLDKIVYQLTKTSAPSVLVKEYDILATDPQICEFKGLDFLVEYELKMLYVQKTPNTNKYEGYKTVQTTCFGEPSKVRNLRASPGSDGVLVVTWDKPAVLNAPEICYYEVVITEKDTANKVTYKTNQLTIRDTLMSNTKSKVINVLAINDKKFDQVTCNANAPDACKQTGSGAETFTWIYNPPVGPTTTKNPNAARSVYNFEYVALISVLLNLVFLL